MFYWNSSRCSAAPSCDIFRNSHCRAVFIQKIGFTSFSSLHKIIILKNPFVHQYRVIGPNETKKFINLSQIGPLFLNIVYKYIQTDIEENHFLHSRDQRKIYPPKLTKNLFLLVITILPLHYRVGRNKK